MGLACLYGISAFFDISRSQLLEILIPTLLFFVSVILFAGLTIILFKLASYSKKKFTKQSEDKLQDTDNE